MPSWTGTSYTMDTTRKSQVLYCSCLLLGMWMAVGSGAQNETALPSLLNKVYSVIENKSVIPFCYTTTLYDITCFWESDRSDPSNYTFHISNDNEKGTCNLMAVPASNSTWWHICHFPDSQVSFLGVNPYEVTVIDTQNNSSFSRKFATEKVVYLEPPTDITIKEQLKPLGLLIIRKESTIDIFSSDLIYEVKYSSEKSAVEKTEIFQRVETSQGYARLFLPGTVRGTEYVFRVRVKADGAYDGYWSQWADFHFKTSDVANVLHVLLYTLGGLILIFAIIMLVAYQRRFLKKKMWPKIPSPEHHFKELYTTHKGNFKLWLDQTDNYLMWMSRNIFHEGPISTLEVLSELPNAMPPPPPTAQLLPKDTYVTLDENFLPHFPAWLIAQRQMDTQVELLSPPEAPIEEKTIRSEGRLEEDVRRSTEEVLSMEESRTYPTKVKPDCLTILREDSLSSEEGKQSPGSSFEYTVLDTCDGFLSPRARSVPPRQPLKYAYLLMSELGQESPPPSPNIYQNSICAPLPAHTYSQC